MAALPCPGLPTSHSHRGALAVGVIAFTCIFLKARRHIPSVSSSTGSPFSVANAPHNHHVTVQNNCLSSSLPQRNYWKLAPASGLN